MAAEKRQQKEDIARNIAFMYGRNKDEEKYDPDKRAMMPTRKFIDADAIRTFDGEYAALDPSFSCPVFLPDELMLNPSIASSYPSYEHALQATRTYDSATRTEISLAQTVREAKKIASKASKSDWKENCLIYAKKLLRDKFIRNKALKSTLMKTDKKTLIYTPEHGDLFWGVDSNPQNGKGQNQYGKLLEIIRNEILRGDDLDNWIKDYSDQIDPEYTDIKVTVEKDGILLSEDCKTFSSKSLIFIGKADDMDLVAAHGSVSRSLLLPFFLSFLTLIFPPSLSPTHHETYNYS